MMRTDSPLAIVAQRPIPDEGSDEGSRRYHPAWSCLQVRRHRPLIQIAAATLPRPCVADLCVATRTPPKDDLNRIPQGSSAEEIFRP